jgi:undecaprenyl-diphosphatase
MTIVSLTLFYLLFGLVQGLTEPIPISSSGHLVIIQDLFNLKMENLTFEVLVNFASLLAVLIIYRNNIIRLATNGLTFLFSKEKRTHAVKQDFLFIVYLIIATIPAGVIGFLFEDVIAETFAGANMVGLTLIVTGVALFIIRNLKGQKSDRDLSLKDAIIVGLSQSVALIPGISRSGATIVAAMLLGMKQETALRFSFLLYIPISFGTFILKVSDIFSEGAGEMILPYATAFIAALVATYFSLRWFMNIMERGNLIYFSIYCFIVGSFAFLIL